MSRGGHDDSMREEKDTPKMSTVSMRVFNEDGATHRNGASSSTSLSSHTSLDPADTSRPPAPTYSRVEPSASPTRADGAVQPRKHGQ